MIPNITRGGRIHGLLAYLVGPARDGSPAEHTDPHLVAGDENVMAWHAGTQLDRASAQQVAQQLDHPTGCSGRGSPSRSSGAAKTGS